MLRQHFILAFVHLLTLSQPLCVSFLVGFAKEDIKAKYQHLHFILCLC